MTHAQQTPADHTQRLRRYAAVRRRTEELCAPLATDDYQVQSIAETSPPKWHLAHVSWFFETFLLEPYLSGYRPFHPRFEYLFNSYYYTLGDMQPRPRRGLLSRPTVEDIYAYRRYVDEHMAALLEASGPEPDGELGFRLELGLNHEQQHQELLLMDIKHNFSVNPLRPAYHTRSQAAQGTPPAPPGWVERGPGRFTVGHGGAGFGFDNEYPAHDVLVPAHRLADRFVTCGEYLAFMDSGGYRRPEHWLADGWALLGRHGWKAPLYWEFTDGGWQVMTLSGMQVLNEYEPVAHLSFYEADAYARWAGKRLPTEAELELALSQQPLAGNFMDDGVFHPQPASPDGQGQWYGDLWAWTASPYAAYPGFKPLAGAMGEYNGKFMCNQMVLRGGSCVTPRSHMRASYRNFFYPHDRWQYSGLRLAEDA